MNSPVTICSLSQPRNDRQIGSGVFFFFLRMYINVTREKLYFKCYFLSVTLFLYLEQIVMEKLCVGKSVEFGIIRT